MMAMLIYIMLIVLLDLNVIQEKQPKKKFKNTYIKSIVTSLNKNIVGFTKQDRHLENFMAQSHDKKKKR